MYASEKASPQYQISHVFQAKKHYSHCNLAQTAREFDTAQLLPSLSTDTYLSNPKLQFVEPYIANSYEKGT